jgi:CheY-like chemotaxis protein
MSAKPVVYFIDDSATMREVIKIAFRREDLDVITCHDASSAMDLMDHSAPDVVITDVIMPGRDGYDVCQYIKQHPRFAQTPVILMSGVVNKGVAERAFAVHANELIRKPFQPQDLIARVRHLLSTPAEAAHASLPQEDTNAANAVLSSIFNAPIPSRTMHGTSMGAAMGAAHGAAYGASNNASNNASNGVSSSASQGASRIAGPISVPRPGMRPPMPSIAATVAAALQPAVVAPPVSIPGAQITGAAQSQVPPAMPGRVPPPPLPGNASDGGRMRLEILRLHSQIKKLEAELSAEREYTKALEQHVNTLSETE